ncbi:MAG: TetR/AcrR family transcriptional regulator [Hyphomicrobiales bacterium]|nr:TetR/AcrR family transcriptional regulator [Hyphomicrobiales bacterium]
MSEPEPELETMDKRVQRSKQTVLAATYKLLSEGGIGGVSVDGVSRLSGVSKTTIYRHWPSRTALLLDACSKLGTGPTIPDTGSLKGDVTMLAKHLAHELQSARWPAVLPSIIDAAERDPDLAQLHAGLHAGLMAPFLEVAERARKRGELAPGQKASEIVAAIVAPFFYRRWFSREPIDEEFVKSAVRDIVGRSKYK